jgi:protoheme IX farnesyltransferase
LWACSLLLTPVAEMGALYGVTAIVTGAVFTYFAVRLKREQTERSAMKLFHWSITYLTILFCAMAADQFLHFA